MQGKDLFTIKELSDVFPLSQPWESYNFIYPLSQYKRLNSTVLRWTDVDPDDSWIATKTKRPKNGLSNEPTTTSVGKCGRLLAVLPKQCNRLNYPKVL